MINKKLTKGSLLLALGIILPQIFHIFGYFEAGQIFLPMHLPVLLGGVVLGPIYGLFIGGILPFLSFLITGMPKPEMAVLMVFELAAYGLASGFLFKTLKLERRKFGIYLTLFAAMIIGRLVNALAIVAAGGLFGMNISSPVAVVYAAYKGLPGIIAQFILIPVIYKALEKGGLTKDA